MIEVKTVYIRVPVQFGKWSARPRVCYELGREKLTGDQIPETLRKAYGATEVEIIYYKIAKFERGAGRKFSIWRWKDKDGKQWEMVGR